MAIKFKAVDDPTTPPVTPPADPTTPAAPTGPSTDEAIAMKKKLEEALAQLDKANEYDQYLAVGDKAQLEKSKALLMADIQVIDYYLKTGEWIGATLPEGAAGEGNKYIDVTELDAGFYVSNPADPTGAPVKLEAKNKDGTGEKLYVDDNGGTAVLTFVMESSTDLSKDMLDVKVKSVGKDAVIEVLFADGTTKKYVVAGGSASDYLQIQIVGVNCTHKISVDATGYANIINPLTGARGGVVIIGSKHDDTLLGGAGRDKIMGAGGNDTIDGGSDVDDIFGYADSEAMVAFGEETLGTDGDDQLYDMFGMNSTTSDSIDGGAGTDTVYRGKLVDGTQIQGNLTEGQVEELNANDPEDINNDDWFGQSVNWEHTVENGEVVFTKTAGTTGGTVDINIPENTEDEKYMASAVKDGFDLVLNVVKPGKEGYPPEYYRIRIKDYFSEDNVKLDITGSFVDMGSTLSNELNVGTNPVVLNGYGDDGDILIGPKTIFEDYAMSVEDLGKSTKDDDELQAQLDLFSESLDPMWAKAKPEDKCIVIEDNDDLKAYTKDGEFNIPTDFGAVAFVKKTDYGYEVTVASNEGLTSKRTVIKIKTTNKELIFKMNGTTSGVYDLTNTSDYGVTINGKGGADFLAGYTYGTKFEDEDGDDAEIKIGVPSTGTSGIKDHPEVPSSGTENEESIGKDIQDAKDLAALKKIYDEKIAMLEKSSDPADKEMAKNLLGELVMKCDSLLDDWIGDLDTAITVYEGMTAGDAKTKEKTKIEGQIKDITDMLKFLKGKEDDDVSYEIDEDDFDEIVEASEDFKSFAVTPSAA